MREKVHCVSCSDEGGCYTFGFLFQDNDDGSSTSSEDDKPNGVTSSQEDSEEKLISKGETREGKIFLGRFGLRLEISAFAVFWTGEGKDAILVSLTLALSQSQMSHFCFSKRKSWRSAKYMRDI